MGCPVSESFAEKDTLINASSFLANTNFTASSKYLFSVLFSWNSTNQVFSKIGVSCSYFSLVHFVLRLT